MGVSLNGGTPKSSHFDRVFHYKPSILGYLYFWKHPYYFIEGSMLPTCYKGTRMVQKNLPTPSPHFVSQLTQAASSSEAPWVQTAGHEANESIPQTSYITILRCVLKPTRIPRSKKNSDIHKKKSGPFLGEDPQVFIWIFGLKKPNYPVIWKILGLFSSPTSGEIDHP